MFEIFKKIKNFIMGGRLDVHLVTLEIDYEDALVLRFKISQQEQKLF